MKTSKRCPTSSLRWMMLIGCIVSGAVSYAQNRDQGVSEAAGQPSTELETSVRELKEQVRDLQSAMVEMRSDWKRSREESEALRQELEQIRSEELPGKSRFVNATASSAKEGAEGRWFASAAALADAGRDEAEQEQPAKANGHSITLEEEYQLLSGKVDDQYQTKVESASKYRVRLSGIVLMNAVSNHGVADSIDLPTVAYARAPGQAGGSFGATLRQSAIGLEAFGPLVAGARTKADVQLDVAGGFPSVPNGINSGIMRLRTATMHMDWANTSVVVGQDAIFFSPNSPTSFASLAVPALSAAGNLWSWVPQIRVEHRVALSDDSSLLFQAGLLDPVSGEVPGTGSYRGAGPGESSRQPAYGARVAWTRTIFGKPLRVGAGGYYNRQDYGFNRTVDGWAGMTDVEVPVSRKLTLSGKLYRGKALGGLYAGDGRSVLFSGDPTSADTQIQAINTVGGWAQLKFRPATKWEFNAAFGMDNPFALDLKYFRYAQAYGDPALARNQGSFINMIYRPRSDILFSAEYRHLVTDSLTEGRNNAGQLNLMMGVLF